MEDSDVDADVDVRDPDEKSIMTYVAQFLQYSKDLPVAEDDVQVCNLKCSCFYFVVSIKPFYSTGKHLKLMSLSKAATVGCSFLLQHSDCSEPQDATVANFCKNNLEMCCQAGY